MGLFHFIFGGTGFLNLASCFLGRHSTLHHAAALHWVFIHIDKDRMFKRNKNWKTIVNREDLEIIRFLKFWEQ
jgi:hypothetical protein